MKYPILILAALFLSAARPIATPPALPPATIHVASRSSVVVLQPTPAVTISSTVNGFTSGGSPAPIGVYTAYGATLEEAATNAQTLDAYVRARATAQAVRP